MKNQADYSLYECPYSHIEKECGHELNGPEGYEETYGVWCACGYRGPVFVLDPEVLNLKKINRQETPMNDRDSNAWYEKTGPYGKRKGAKEFWHDEYQMLILNFENKSVLAKENEVYLTFEGERHFDDAKDRADEIARQSKEGKDNDD